MSSIKDYNGYFSESEFESAIISMLRNNGWDNYSLGKDIKRETKKDVLIEEDFKSYLETYDEMLDAEDIKEIYDKVRLIGSESDFTTLHMIYNLMVNGMQYTPKSGTPIMVSLINFDIPKLNVFRVVNQFSIEYTNNGQKETRRPDVLLYINGIPVCIFELKNPSDDKATIYDAWEQINIRYWRDIPHLLHYCPLALITDGVKTRLGTVRTPYEHFYSWRRVNDNDKISTLPFEETETMIKGVYATDRFLEIFRDYIYFQDSIYDADEVEIVCRYPQFLLQDF